MTIYDVPNIEHCDVATFGSLYRVVAHPGWYIYRADEIPGADEDGNPIKIYKTIAFLPPDFDFSLVEVTVESAIEQKEQKY